MKVELLYFDECPNWRVADERLRDALCVAGLDDLDVEMTRVETAEQAAVLGFVGSPTLLIDGRDPWSAGSQQPGLACRLFSTPDGLAGSPTLEQLIEVVTRSMQLSP